MFKFECFSTHAQFKMKLYIHTYIYTHSLSIIKEYRLQGMFQLYQIQYEPVVDTVQDKKQIDGCTGKVYSGH